MRPRRSPVTPLTYSDRMSADPFNFGPPNRQPASQSTAPLPARAPGPVPPAGPFGPPGQPSSRTPAATSLSIATPPAWILFLAAGVALIAGIVAIVWESPLVAIGCWFAAGPAAIGLLAFFVDRDTAARASGLYAAPGWVKPLHYGAIGVCLVAVLAPALRIAEWVGRL